MILMIELQSFSPGKANCHTTFALIRAPPSCTVRHTATSVFCIVMAPYSSINKKSVPQQPNSIKGSVLLVASEFLFVYSKHNYIEICSGVLSLNPNDYATLIWRNIEGQFLLNYHLRSCVCTSLWTSDINGNFFIICRVRGPTLTYIHKTMCVYK